MLTQPVMEQNLSLPPVLPCRSVTRDTWRPDRENAASMGSGSVQLPPLSEILAGVDRNGQPENSRGSYEPPAPSRDYAPNFPEAQSLAPSPTRWRPSYPSTSTYPSESSLSSEYSDRRSSYASPASSASVTSTKTSPVLPAMPYYSAQHRAPAPDHSNGRGLPPLYAGPDQAGRGAPSPTRPGPYPSPYGSMAPQEYVGPYTRVPPSHGPPGAPMYGGGYDSMGDYGDGKQKRRRGNLPKAVTDILRHWFQEHLAHPYPTEEEKQSLMAQTGLSMSQISNWFINARRRSMPNGGQRPPQPDGHPP